MRGLKVRKRLELWRGRDSSSSHFQPATDLIEFKFLYRFSGMKGGDIQKNYPSAQYVSSEGGLYKGRVVNKKDNKKGG